jgi:hypothetical protein
LTRRIRQRQEGFTLVELLVASAVGMMIVLAALAILDLGIKQAGKVVDRSDSVQRARVAMYTIATQLRSQVCLDQSTPPIAAASPYSVSFYTFTSAGKVTPELHTISLNANAQSIVEQDWTGNPPNPNNPPARTKTLLTSVTAPPGTNAPIFTYYGFLQAADGSVTWDRALPSTLGAADLGNVARVAISFTALASPRGTTPAPASAPSTTLTEDVLSRMADPNDPSNGPTAAECAGS